MSATVQPRDGRVSQPGEFVELALPHLEQMAAIERQSFTNPWSKAELGWVVRDEEFLCLGAQVGGELIGYSIGQFQAAQFHLASLAIAPAWRRQGWGGQLLGEVLRRAGQRGCLSCQLEVRAGNREAGRLYGRHGFRQVGIWPRYYTRPVEDALVMYREL